MGAEEDRLMDELEHAGSRLGIVDPEIADHERQAGLLMGRSIPPVGGQESASLAGLAETIAITGSTIRAETGSGGAFASTQLRDEIMRLQGMLLVLRGQDEYANPAFLSQLMRCNAAAGRALARGGVDLSYVDISSMEALPDGLCKILWAITPDAPLELRAAAGAAR